MKDNEKLCLIYCIILPAIAFMAYTSHIFLEFAFIGLFIAVVVHDLWVGIWKK